MLAPTLPRLPSLKGDQQNIYFDIRSHYRSARPEEWTNYDAFHKPPDRYNYFESSTMLVPITTSDLQDPQPKPLPFRHYFLPNRAEMAVLEVLWAKPDVQDTTIYSCLDTVLNITMMDLNQLLEGMARKGLVSRKIVSPRNEFNAFGVLIEMSPQNQRNRVYEYRALVDRELMRSFIDAHYYLFKRDSNIVNLKRLEAAKRDSTLLPDLNRMIQRVQDRP
ncbi:MAG: hypothetical protein ONB31_05385 [candidate division KSB1 bacterium]|nr:hypothetical protein [candidate division KSB1 bacterium]MDZ7333629.1 hypothetical protein [candidate division KSB1 bacterium]MDZ7357815.1 hypothetical protein [candidate division KSB1 bacterium]MDZ7398743.1 hypothetical protein [candidate division KSB1 bacterium]